MNPDVWAEDPVGLTNPGYREMRVEAVPQDQSPSASASLNVVGNLCCLFPSHSVLPFVFKEDNLESNLNQKVLSSRF
eukprot:1159523-Pelagomonas_calceolata.AAC.3